MASRPKLRALCAKIEDLGGDDYVLDMLRDGQPVRAIATALETSRGMIYHWRQAGGEDRQRAWDAARAESAESLVEDAGQILDDLEGTDPSNAQVAIARSRADHRRWLAERFNRETFGESKGPAGVLVLGDLHLQSLQKFGSAHVLPPAESEPIEEADYTVVEEEDVLSDLLRE